MNTDPRTGQAWGTGIAAGAKVGAVVTVNAGGVDTEMQAPRDLTLAAGDLVTYLRVGSNWYVLARYGTGAVAAQPDNPDPPPAKPTSITGTRVITPVATRSYRSSGWSTADTVIQGEFGGTGLHTGCAFYGDAPQQLAGATVDAVTVRMRRADAGGPAGAQPLTLWLLDESVQPAGAPTRGASTAGPSLAHGQAATFTLPDSWGQDLVDGNAGGIAVYDADGTPYVVLSGLADYVAAFTLTIEYTRTL